MCVQKGAVLISQVSQCTQYEDELDGLFEQEGYNVLGHELDRRDKFIDLDPNNDVEVLEELDPCGGAPKCRGLFQIRVPPSCECACPSDSDKNCSPQKIFDDNICECICRDINVNCPGKSDFNFDVCNCVCHLNEEDCGLGKRLDPSRCVCTDIEVPPTPEQQPPTSQCPSNAAWKCKRDTQYLDPQTCTCVCRRYLVKKPYYNQHYGRYPSHYGRGFHGGDEEDESRSKRSSSGSDSGRKNTQPSFEDSRSGFQDRRPLYALTCPAGKRVDHKSCVCYW